MDMPSNSQCRQTQNAYIFFIQSKGISVPITTQFMSLRRGVLDTTLWYKDCQWLSTGRWFSLFSLGIPITSNTTETLLKVVLNAITLTHNNVPLSLYNQWMHNTQAYTLPCTVNKYMTQGHPPEFIQLMDL